MFFIIKIIANNNNNNYLLVVVALVVIIIRKRKKKKKKGRRRRGRREALVPLSPLEVESYSPPPPSYAQLHLDSNTLDVKHFSPYHQRDRICSVDGSWLDKEVCGRSFKRHRRQCSTLLRQRWGQKVK